MDGETLRSFRGVVRHGTAHCLEAALAAAMILEQHRYPPLVLSFESIDLLDHVIFVYRTPTGWGSVARSRDPGLHGRKPLYATPRALAQSYFESYIDYTGCIKAYGVVDLRVMGRYDWRLSEKNVWAVEQMLLELPHHALDLRFARDVRDLFVVEEPAPEIGVERALRSLADAGDAGADVVERTRELALVGGEAGLDEDHVDGHRRDSTRDDARPARCVLRARAPAP